MDFWDRIDEVAREGSVLRHSFYLRWAAGELTQSELALYSGQYAHAVQALAAASRHAAAAAPSEQRAELAGHAAEEEEHVGLWARFAEAVGGDADAQPLPETTRCVEAWADPERPLLETLVALYAIESAQPAISETKRSGLVEHYGLDSEAATAYFDVHAVRDVEHARQTRRVIATQLHGADLEPLVSSAEKVLAANWLLLDGVEKAARAQSARATSPG